MLIEAVLNTGDSEQRQIVISNNGDEDLTYSVEVEVTGEPEQDARGRSLRGTDRANGPRRDNPGDLLGQFNGINQNGVYCSAGGWDTDNEVMWVTNSNNEVAAYSFDDDYENIEEVFTFRTNNWTIFNTWAQGVIYTTADWQQVIYRWDQEGNQLDQFRINFPNFDISADSENGWFFIMQTDNNAIHVYELDGEGGIGEQIGLINNHSQFHNNNNNGYGFVWVPEHIGNGGPLWYNVAGNGVYQVDVDVDEWVCVENDEAVHFNAGLNDYFDGVGHDAHNIWAAGSQQANIRIYDDGVAELRWVEIVPPEGMVQPNSEMDLDVVLNATDLIEGRYEAEVTFLSNDPATPEVPVIVVINVTGVPLFDLENEPIPQPLEGWVDLVLPDTYIDDDIGILTLSVVNGGTRDLEINEVFIAFTTEGRLVGAGMVHDGRCGLAVWGDDEFTKDAVDGLLESEAYTLKIWDADREVELNMMVKGIKQGAGLVYETDALTILDLTVDPGIPDDYYLAQNYPNPFNAVTHIAFGLPEASKVSIKVYDVTGRQVATLIEGERKAGHHLAVWSGQNIASGLYLVRMEATGFKSVRKVMLVK